jgi:hypothetical protein
MRYVRLAALIPAVVLAFAAQAAAGNWKTFGRACVPEWVEIPDFMEELPVPVGCEVVDCCPGCPGPGPLDWEILVDEKITKSVTLRFDGISQGALSRLKLGGSARLVEGAIVVGPGKSSIGGFPQYDGDRPPVAWVQSTLRADKDKADDADAGVDILQLRRGYIVNRFSTHWIVGICPQLFEDTIKTSNNIGGDSAVILADYRKAGCENDVLHRTTGSVGIGNAVTNGACNSEVSVFSDDNAMSFQPGVNTWTGAIGDIHKVALKPVITVPVTVWVARAGAVAAATDDMANANLLYNQNNVGVQFDATINDVSGDPNAVATIGGTAGDCATAGALAGTAFHTADTLNIYYVNGAFTGVNCGANRNVNFLGTIANIASLPHEIGHAYSLRPSASGGHVNNLPGFGNDNIMFAGGPATRSNFTVGQAFRLNVSDISMLNVNGDRTDPTRSCPPLTTDALCPDLALDSLPH